MIEAIVTWMTMYVSGKDLFLVTLILLISNIIQIRKLSQAANDRRQVYELLRTVSTRIVRIEEQIKK